AIDVSDSDPNVVYVGTGESPIRGVTTSHGDGVYKSVDAGASWTHVGLKNRGQISTLVIHPTDPDTALVAVQGNIWGPNEERGVFKTTDGGETWAHVLKVDADTGASDLVMDPSNPRILYAGMWNHRRNPWFVKSGGTSGGIFKSTDGGDTWEELTKGLPELVGKIGIDVAASNPNKLYAIVEAEEGGLFVSENGGESWTNVNNDRIIQARAWYYNHVKVDPTDENTLFILNAPLLKSIDGGKTFEPRPAPHGDHHDIWFNPEDGQNFINANDGGATVTFDGGESWSSIYNQPTAQFYRVNADNLMPYTVYGGQQDNSTIAITSDDFDGDIGPDNYSTVGGGESAHIAFDVDNPRLIYATTINSTLTEFDAELERTRLIKPYP
ncbi:MAG: glycosyl hydrolase, partial [Pseudomonadota bacterium]